MTTDRQQLAMNLSYLIKNEDVIPGPLLNEILIEYVELINNNVGTYCTYKISLRKRAKRAESIKKGAETPTGGMRLVSLKEYALTNLCQNLSP